MPTKVGKEARKSDDITGMLERNKMTAVTPNAKQKSERERDNVKKSKRERKNDLLKYFGKGVRVPAPTNVATPINAVLQQRESREKGNYTNDKAGEEGRGVKKQSLGKSSILPPNNARAQGNKSSTNFEVEKGETLQEAEKEGEYEVNLEAMSKTLLKEKGRKGDTKQKKKKDTSEEANNRMKAKKKATFAEMVEKDPNSMQKIDYKKCVVGFAIRVDKGNNTKGGFDKKIIEELNFMQTYIDKHASFHPIGKDQTAKPIREKADMPKYQITLRSYFSIPNPWTFDKMSQDGGRVIRLSSHGVLNRPPDLSRGSLGGPADDGKHHIL
jgi:hypothetical protein